MLRSLLAFLKLGATEARKESAKTLVVAIAIVVVWQVFSAVGQADRLFSPSGKFEVERLLPWIRDMAESAIAGTWAYAQRHPIRASSIAVGVTILSWFLVIGRRYWKQAVVAVREVFRRLELIDRVGLFAFFENTSASENSDPWIELRGELSAGSSILYYLGASGWETFGRNAPLHEQVSRFAGSIRVILMDPNCSHLANRAASVKVNPKSYKKQITKSIELLRELKQQGRHIELRLYNSSPNWKLIFTDLAVWVQHYSPGEHVADSPVYRYYSTDDRKGMFQAFFDDFHRIWDSSRPCTLEMLKEAPPAD